MYNHFLAPNITRAWSHILHLVRYWISDTNLGCQWWSRADCMEQHLCLKLNLPAQNHWFQWLFTPYDAYIWGSSQSSLFILYIRWVQTDMDVSFNSINWQIKGVQLWGEHFISTDMKPLFHQADAHHRRRHLQGVVEDPGPAAQCRAVVRPQHGAWQPVAAPLPLGVSEHVKSKETLSTLRWQGAGWYFCD